MKEVPGTTNRTGLYSLLELICHVFSEVTWKGCPADNHKRNEDPSSKFKRWPKLFTNWHSSFATRIWGRWFDVFGSSLFVGLAWLAFVCLSPTDSTCASMQSKVPHEVLDKRAERQRTVTLSGRPVGPKLGFPWSFTTVWCQTMELPTSLKHSR